ncbi:MAG: double zinc ribbon domain-containing protein, partial [bacterium]
MNLMYDLRLFFDEIATFLLSPECFLCGEKLDTYKVVLCDNCVQGLERYRNPFCLMCGKEIRDGKIICCGDSPVEFVFAVGNYKMGWGRLVEAFKLQRQV